MKEIPKGKVAIHRIPYVQKYVMCVDDTKPNGLMVEQDWIKKGEIYLLREWVQTALNQSDDASYMLSKLDGTPIQVSDTMRGYRSSRFVDADVLSIHLN